MKTIVITLIFLSSFSSLFSQISQDLIIKKKANDSIVDIDTLVGIKNKPIVFEYDTVYIINRFGVSEFIRCVNDLNRVKNLSGSLNGLSSNMFSIQTNVNSMYSNMQSVTSFINNYERETKLKLDMLSTDNLKLSQNMQSVTKELEEARQKIIHPAGERGPLGATGWHRQPGHIRERDGDRADNGRREEGDRGATRPQTPGPRGVCRHSGVQQ